MDEIIKNYMATSLDAMSMEEANKIKKFEHNYAAILPEDRDAILLDIGVGRGEMLMCQARWGYRHARGIDISPSTIQHCQSLGLDCELVEDTVSYLSRNPETFDGITLLDVLEHVEKKDTISLLKAVRNSLKPGGFVIIQVPNLAAPDGFLIRYHDFTHEVGFTEISLRQVLIAGGFKDFFLKGLEEFWGNSWKTRCGRFLRGVYWRKVRIERRLNTNSNPKILNPVLFAVAKEQ